jgi:nitrate/nitrite transport system ATP-binding protein
VFKITHDVDEAIYPADRVVLMTNGPGAVLAEIVENPLPKARARRRARIRSITAQVQPHHRFPVSRSKNFAADTYARGYVAAACGAPGRAGPVVAAGTHVPTRPPGPGRA